MVPTQMEAAVYTAGVLLCFMSVVDTLAYSVRTAGVRVKRLAISISLFNILVTVARQSNLIQAPILGNLPDKVKQGAYTSSEVLAGLRTDVLFIAAGVVIGAILTPSFLRLSVRGIAVLEERHGSLLGTLGYALRRLGRLPHYFRWPNLPSLKPYLDLGRIPTNMLAFNVLVTCFYSIGVMSTLLAASIEPELSVTNATLSGIVNGLATVLLFFIVDPPAAVLVDQCISGKRPASDSVTMHLYMVATRFLGVALGYLLLPFMAQYVLWAAHLVNRVF